MGAIAFIAIYGVKILNPTYVDWLLGWGDLSQHYLGWELFRMGDWKFPLGLTDMAAYPLETSVIFTDSIPIFALFLKYLKTYFLRTFNILEYMECYVLDCKDCLQQKY